MAVISYAPTSPDQRVQRRRILFSDYTAKRKRPVPAKAEPVAVEAAIEPDIAPAPKGTCPKCGQHIGRGISFHVKTCQGA